LENHHVTVIIHISHSGGHRFKFQGGDATTLGCQNRILKLTKPLPFKSLQIRHSEFEAICFIPKTAELQ